MDKSWQVSLMYVIMHLGLIFFMYPGDIIASADDGHWIPIVLGFAVHLAAIAIYLKGIEDLGNKDIVSLYLGIGRGIPVLFLLPVAVYFFLIVIVTVRGLSEIMSIVFLSSTPIWAVMLLFLLVSTYFAFTGIRSIFRTGVLAFLLNVPIILFFFSTSIQNVDWRYVFPLISDSTFLTNPSYFQSFFVFAGGFLFLGFVRPFVSYRRRSILIGALSLLPFILFSVYIPILTFGQATASTFNFPFIEALDTISLTWFMFDRITIFLLLSLISFLMLYLSINMWAMMRVINQSFPVLKPVYILLSIPFCAFMICLFIPNWKDIEKFFWWDTYLRFYILITIPLSTCFFASRYKKRKVGV